MLEKTRLFEISLFGALVLPLCGTVVLFFIVAIVTQETGWAVTGATIALAIATIYLARHTQNLVSHTQHLGIATDELGKIEMKRDLRNRIETTINLLREIQSADAESVVSRLAAGNVNHPPSIAIRRLAIDTKTLSRMRRHERA